eukprot:14550-Amorphochlora_amoeboformis.AAC.1
MSRFILESPLLQSTIGYYQPSTPGTTYWVPGTTYREPPTDEGISNGYYIPGTYRVPPGTTYRIPPVLPRVTPEPPTGCHRVLPTGPNGYYPTGAYHTRYYPVVPGTTYEATSRNLRNIQLSLCGVNYAFDDIQASKSVPEQK